MKEDFREFILDKTDTFVLDLLDFLPAVKIPIIVDQLMRSGTSIGANIHEGQGTQSRRELARYLEISLRSARETAYWLLIISKLKLGFSERAKVLMGECDQIERVLFTSINSLRHPKIITHKS